jgi:hypothetical protein
MGQTRNGNAGDLALNSVTVTDFPAEIGNWSLPPHQLFRQNRHTAGVKAVSSKTVLCDIKSDCGSRV